MDPGQVSFFNSKAVKSCTIAKKKNEVINRLERTKVERVVDLQAEREQRDKEERHEEKMALVAKQQADKVQREEDKKKADLKAYVGFGDSTLTTSNQTPVDLDDFM